MSRRSRAVCAGVVALVAAAVALRVLAGGAPSPEELAERRALEAQLQLVRSEVLDELFARGEVVTERVGPGESTRPTVARRGQALVTECRAEPPGEDGTAVVRSATFDQRTHPRTSALLRRLDELGG